MRTRKPIILMVVLLQVVMIPALPAQQAPQPPTLNNETVILSFKTGTPENYLVSWIESNPCTFDTAPIAIEYLKHTGVPQSVIDAMIKMARAAQLAATPPGASGTPPSPPVAQTQSPQAAPPPQPSSVSDPNAYPADIGAFYKSPTGWTQMRDAPPAAGDAKTSIGAVTGWGGATVLQTFAGITTSLQIAERSPMFFFNNYGWDERTIHLVKLEVNVKKSRREFAINAKRNEIKKDQLVELTTKLINMGPQGPRFTVTPKTPLQPGEYMFTSLSIGGLAYDFTVTQ